MLCKELGLNHIQGKGRALELILIGIADEHSDGLSADPVVDSEPLPLFVVVEEQQTGLAVESVASFSLVFLHLY